MAEPAHKSLETYLRQSGAVNNCHLCSGLGREKAP